MVRASSSARFAFGALLSWLIYVLSGALGVATFIYPFFLPVLPEGSIARSSEAALVTGGLVALAILALMLETQGRAMGAKMVAVLGVLVAITSVLRFVAVAVPGLGGISPVFAPIILAGYVFGARFGLLMGTFTLLVSALITGGIGPWLPYQMFAAGWTGLTAGWLGTLPGRTARPSKHEIVALAAFGFLWGLLFGAIMNLYFWPFVIGPHDRSWTPGAGIGEAVARYAVFYVATSLWWDVARGIGNAALIVLLGPPMLRALERFRRRFQFVVEAAE